MELRDSGQFVGAVGVGLADATLTERGRTEHRSSPDHRQAQIRRAFVVGDAVYTVSEAGLETGNLTDLAERDFVALPATAAAPP